MDILIWIYCISALGYAIVEVILIKHNAEIQLLSGETYENRWYRVLFTILCPVLNTALLVGFIVIGCIIEFSKAKQ